MALSLIKPYFRTAMTGLGSDFKEWTDGFNFQNIPSNLYDKAYHLKFGTIQGDAFVGNTQYANCSFEVRMFFKGYRDVGENVDRAIQYAEDFIEIVQVPATRLTSDLKNVKMQNLIIDESFSSNDNLILVTMTFGVTFFIC